MVRALPYVIVGAAATYLYYAVTKMEFHARAGTLGPDFWPKVVLAGLLVICLYEVMRIVVFRGTEASGVLQEIAGDSEAAHEGEGYVHVEAKSPLLLIAGILWTALYVWLIQRLGFVVATAPYLAGFLALGGYRRWGVNAAVSVIGTLLMMFFFMKVVYVSLPIGQEPFAQVTLALMRLMGIR